MSVLHDTEHADEIAALRARVDLLERVFERIFGDKPRRFHGPKKKEPVLPIKCPDCGAEPNERCVTQHDKPTNVHIERLRAHTRSFFDER